MVGYKIQSKNLVIFSIKFADSVWFSTAVIIKISPILTVAKINWCDINGLEKEYNLNMAIYDTERGKRNHETSCCNWWWNLMTNVKRTKIEFFYRDK